MGDLTKNFSLWEFRCRCGCGFDQVNMTLVHALQEVRDLLGVPLHVNSGCRCPTHNAAIGGVPDSQHVLGNAADVCGPPVTRVRKAMRQVAAFREGGIGQYPTFTHGDVRGYRARWKG